MGRARHIPSGGRGLAEQAAVAGAIRLLAVMLSPFAPHLSGELCATYGATESLQASSWPEYDPAVAADDWVKYAVQINGKLRADVELPVAATEAEVRGAAAADDRVKPHLAGKTVKKFVFVKGRLVNFVVAG